MTERTLTVAYADPPYIGQADRYRDHPDYAGEVDHGALIDRLISDYPDGWALSCHMPSLYVLLGLCDERGLSLMAGDLRIHAWCKSFVAHKPNVRVAYAWEPVIIRPPDRLPGAPPTRDFAFDQQVVIERIAMMKGLDGAKPERFCFWLFNVLGLRPCDTLHDLYPGTGGVAAAWDWWRRLGGPKLQQHITVMHDLQKPKDQAA